MQTSPFLPCLRRQIRPLSTQRRFRPEWVITLLVLLSLLTTGIVRAQLRPHEQTLQDAWTLAERAGRYTFTSQVTQKTIPAPRLANVGQTVRTDHLTVQGEIDRRADTLQLALWENQATAFDPARALEIRIEAGKAQGRLPDGEWQALDDFTDSFAPGGDVASYLLAARRVTDLGIERRDLAPFGEMLLSHRYQFIVDGDALSALITAQLEAEMRRKGELPPGVTLGLGHSFRQMVGIGEAWLDADGLPQRMKVEIEFPQQQNGERVLVSVQTDFTSFDRARLDGSALGNRLRLVGYGLAQALDLGQIAIGLAFTLLLGVAVFWLSRLPTRRRQMAVSGALLFVMIIVEIGKAAPLPIDLASASPAPAQSAPAQRPMPSPTPGFNTRQNPLGDEAASVSEPGLYSRAALDEPQALIAGPDADKDGLSDALESAWGTNPSVKDTDGDGLLDGQEAGLCADVTLGTVAGKLTGKNSYDVECPNPLVLDTDGDGLTDAQEMLRLGTSPNGSDSDGDGLLDKIEVQGFSAGSETRYTDPVNPDTDGDGILDGTECPAGNCINSGGTAELDVFEIDNDGDGFYGSFDLSPNLVMGGARPLPKPIPFN